MTFQLIHGLNITSAEVYCLLPKADKAVAASACPWPYVPPLCDVTWFEHTGEAVAYLASACYLSVMFYFCFITTRGEIWTLANHKANTKAKPGFFDRTPNEWLNLYSIVGCYLQVFMDIDYGEGGKLYMDYKVYFVLFKLRSYISTNALFTLLWGWYKIELDPKDTVKKGRRADILHNVGRASLFCTEVGSAVLAVYVFLPEEYADAGVYWGTPHAIARAYMEILIIVLGFLILRLGLRIKNKLKAGAAKKVVEEKKKCFGLCGGKKVAPDENGDIPELTAHEKIFGMVKKTGGVIFVCVLYFILDISASFGKVRHVTAPTCSAASAFVRVPVFIIIMVVYVCCHSFPIKNPNQKEIDKKKKAKRRASVASKKETPTEKESSSSSSSS